MTFQHALNDILVSMIQQVILSKAPVSQEDGFTFIRVGDINLLIDKIGYTVSVTNFTDAAATTFMPSSTMSMTTTSIPYVTYCKFMFINVKIILYIGKFCENLIFPNNIKRHIYICDVKNSRLGHDTPISVNDRVILPFCEGFIFTKLLICKVCENKTRVKIYQFTVFIE